MAPAKKKPAAKKPTASAKKAAAKKAPAKKKPSSSSSSSSSSLPLDYLFEMSKCKTTGEKSMTRAACDALKCNVQQVFTGNRSIAVTSSCGSGRKSRVDVAILESSQMKSIDNNGLKTVLIADSDSILILMEYSPAYYHTFAKATNMVERPETNKLEKGRRYIVNGINKRRWAMRKGVPFLESRDCQNQETLKTHIKAVIDAKGTKDCVRVINKEGEVIAMDNRCTIPADQPPIDHLNGPHILDWSKQELTIAS